MKKRPIIITATNAITIPKKVRALLDLQPGDCLDYEVMVTVQSFWLARIAADLVRFTQPARLHGLPKSVNRLNGWRMAFLSPSSSL